MWRDVFYRRGIIISSNIIFHSPRFLAILECLGETLWNAQRQGGDMDANNYIERVRQIAQG